MQKVNENGTIEEKEDDDFKSLKEKGSTLSVHTGSPEAIKATQKRLNDLGYTDFYGRKLTEDGIYGTNTFNAVIKFQEDNDLVADGVVGDKTWESLSEKNNLDFGTPKSSLDARNHGVFKAIDEAFNKELYEKTPKVKEQEPFEKAKKEKYHFPEDIPIGQYEIPLIKKTTDEEIPEFDINAGKIAAHVYNHYIDEDGNVIEKEPSFLSSVSDVLINPIINLGTDDTFKAEPDWEMIDKYEGGDDMEVGVYVKREEADFETKAYTEYILAFEGTNSAIDWKNNFQQITGPDSRDMQEAISFARKFKEEHPGTKITFVGHSKGGAEAIAAATATGCDAVVFNPAVANLDDYGLSSKGYKGNITAYVVDDELLNTVQNLVNDHVDVRYLPKPFIGRLGSASGIVGDIIGKVLSHSMNTVNSSMNKVNKGVR